MASVGGICGAGTEVIVNLRPENAEAAIAGIKRRSRVVKSTGGFMFELEFNGVTFRLFSSGKLVFRGVKNRAQLDQLLYSLLCQS